MPQCPRQRDQDTAVRLGVDSAAEISPNTFGHELETPENMSCSLLCAQSHLQVLIAVIFPSHICGFCPKPLGCMDEPLGQGKDSFHGRSELTAPKLLSHMSLETWLPWRWKKTPGWVERRVTRIPKDIAHVPLNLNLCAAGAHHHLSPPTLPWHFQQPRFSLARARAGSPAFPRHPQRCQSGQGCPDIFLPLMSPEAPQASARPAAPASLTGPAGTAEPWPSPPALEEGLSRLVPTHP